MMISPPRSNRAPPAGNIETSGWRCVKQFLTSSVRTLPRLLERNTPFQELPELIQKAPFLRDVFHWVEKTPYTHLKTASLAKHLHITQRTLSRKIVTTTGYNSAQLMRLIKLNQISELLISTNKPVYRISDEMGFADDTSLRRSFKRITNMTPGEYRRSFA
ncbi:helix-turn-helix domain-containing protein [Halomonas faecis]|uniref:helix-turn-helix domain-containing protein n=1 Tax=Halomonas faecis TaxID=1562110 RepID=UPI0013D3713E|nr:helix-turn-helix transcriptional regulator [Halomonas faecis]